MSRSRSVSRSASRSPVSLFPSIQYVVHYYYLNIIYLLYFQRRDDDRKSRSPSRSRSRSRSRDSRYSLLNKRLRPVYTLFTLAVVQPTITFDLGSLLSRCGIFGHCSSTVAFHFP